MAFDFCFRGVHIVRHLASHHITPYPQHSLNRPEHSQTSSLHCMTTQPFPSWVSTQTSFKHSQAIQEHSGVSRSIQEHSGNTRKTLGKHLGKHFQVLHRHAQTPGNIRKTSASTQTYSDVFRGIQRHSEASGNHPQTPTNKRGEQKKPRANSARAHLQRSEHTKANTWETSTEHSQTLGKHCTDTGETLGKHTQTLKSRENSRKHSETFRKHSGNTRKHSGNTWKHSGNLQENIQRHSALRREQRGAKESKGRGSSFSSHSSVGSRLFHWGSPFQAFPPTEHNLT